MAIRQKEAYSFLPDFCDVRSVFIVVLLGELLAVVLTLASSELTHSMVTDLAAYSLFIQWVGLCCAATLCFAKDYFKHMSCLWVTCLSYTIILLISLLITELVWRLIYIEYLPAQRAAAEHTKLLLRNLGISAITGALCLRYFYIQYQWRRSIELTSNERLKALQSRIRPHFLFNCMNTIASLTRKDPDLAEKTVEDMADLFRAYINEVGYLSTLADEVALCKRYLNIESLRFGDRLQVNWEIDNLPGKLLVPALTIQPILENAIYHGIESLPEGGLINICSQSTPKEVIIIITNPLAVKDSTHQGNQIAQENIRQRLSAYYGEKGHLSVTSDGQQYVTKITVPNTL